MGVRPLHIVGCEIEFHIFALPSAVWFGDIVDDFKERCKAKCLP